MLKIGLFDCPAARGQAAMAQAALQQQGLQSAVIFFNVSETTTFSDSEITAALLRGNLHAAFLPLNQLPTRLPEGLAITALSQRDQPADVLAYRPEAAEAGKIFKLKSGAKVGAATALRRAQLLDIRPDLALYAQAGPFQDLREAPLDAWILAAADAALGPTEQRKLEMLELQPREFIPAPGQGVLAWLCLRDDLVVRRAMKPLHHPEVSVCTNVERRVQQALGDEQSVGVFVERDAGGNFHAFAALAAESGLRRVRLSQSTHLGLGDRIARALWAG